MYWHNLLVQIACPIYVALSHTVRAIAAKPSTHSVDRVMLTFAIVSWSRKSLENSPLAKQTNKPKR